ncbi:MAG TPA: hypothetical protein VK926_04580 [Gaiellaceae bacterium]|nr:hypothetical protein [Gaiellaceae bacterium]
MSAFSLLLAKSAADEGRDIIVSMLVVGLVFLAVVVLGDLYQSRTRKRHYRS